MFRDGKGGPWPILIMATMQVSTSPGKTCRRRPGRWLIFSLRRALHDPCPPRPSTLFLLLEGADRALRKAGRFRAPPARESRRSRYARRFGRFVADGENPGARGS